MDHGETSLSPAPFVTSCRDCVFAEYEGETQEGCSLGRIDKFEGQGVRVLGVDDGHLRYLTVGRFCNAVRKADTTNPLPLSSLVETVRAEVRPRVAFLVYVGEGHTIDDLSSSIETVEGQGVKLVVLLDNARVSPPAAISLIGRMKVRCDWEVVRVEPGGEESYPGGRVDMAVDLGVGRLDERRHTYYSFGEAGYRWWHDYVDTLDAAVNDEMVAVGVVRPEYEGRNDGYAALTKLHRHPDVVGNVGGNILGKIEALEATSGGRWCSVNYEDMPSCG